MGERICMKSIEQIESSGEVPSMPQNGISLRGDNRGYLQSDFGVLEDTSVLEHADRVAERVVGQQYRGVTRAVGRFLVAENILSDIAKNEKLSARVEAVFPTSLRMPDTNERVMVLMASRNDPNRTSIVPRVEMIRQVQEDQAYRADHPVHHSDRIVDLRNQGYQFISQIPKNLIGSVHALWESTFGWELSGVRSRALNVYNQSFNPRLRKAPQERSVWFSGLLNPRGELVAAATAERADMRTGKGLPPISMVETSEWSSRERRKGLMAATNIHLMAQVLRSLRNLPVSPTIFGETNDMSKAYRVGLASGMSVGPHSVRGLLVPQILEQHVTVGDGYLPQGLREFIPMFLDDDVKKDQYGEKDIQIILGSRPERMRTGGGI